MDVAPPPHDEAPPDRGSQRSSVLASPAFWLAALGSLCFWVAIVLLIAI